MGFEPEPFSPHLVAIPTEMSWFPAAEVERPNCVMSALSTQNTSPFWRGGGGHTSAFRAVSGIRLLALRCLCLSCRRHVRIREVLENY
jgi:hypothetical protein